VGIEEHTVGVGTMEESHIKLIRIVASLDSNGEAYYIKVVDSDADIRQFLL